MISRRRIKRFWYYIIRLQREMGYDDCLGMAAQIAYYIMLGVFPFLLFMLTLISYLPIGLDLQNEALRAMQEALPGEAFGQVDHVVADIIRDRSGLQLLLGLAAGLFWGSQCISVLITTINRAYNTRQRRSIVTQKILAIKLTLVLSVLWILSSAITLSGQTVTNDVFAFLGLQTDDGTFWGTIRIPLVLLLNFWAFAMLYFYAPEAKQQFRWILPGAITSTFAWFLASDIFRKWVGSYGDYSLAYGSLAAVVVLLIWFWISGLIFLLGAEINALNKRIEDGDSPRRFRPLR